MLRPGLIVDKNLQLVVMLAFAFNWECRLLMNFDCYLLTLVLPVCFHLIFL